MISSAAMPATGLPRKPRGVSPQAVVVSRPTDSSRRQISGTSSISIQWYWMFCRSLMSALPRANSVEIPPSTRKASGESAWPSVRTRSMKYRSLSSSSLSWAVRPPSMPGLRWV